MLDKLREIENILRDNSELEFSFDADLSKFSTMRLKAQGHMVTVFSADALSLLIKNLYEREVPYQLLGLGANTVFPERVNRLLIKLKLPFDKKKITPKTFFYDLPASVPLSVMSSLALRYGLKGWEVFTGIPGTLGGGIFMNAGTSLGEIGELIKEVTLCNFRGEIRLHRISEGDFSYRRNHFLHEGDIILSARVSHRGRDELIPQLIKNYLGARMESQPLKEKTCGCMFKNLKIDDELGELTCRAGEYLDIMGLGGFGLNKNLRISPKHANFMENRDGAALRDVVDLINFSLRELEIQYGIVFEKEVQISY